MLIIATFENSIFVELAITAVEQQNISKDHIFVIPLNKRVQSRKVFDSIHKADGFSMFDLAAILGTCFMLLGAIYGYVLEWGPIIWGIIGALSGILLGFLIKYWMIKSQIGVSQKITSEVVVMIRVEDEKTEKIIDLLWDHNALGVSSTS